MGWQVIFSPRSEQDLRRIVKDVAKDDPAAAERVGLALIRTAEELARSPYLGTVMRQRANARFVPFGPYLVIYRTHQRGAMVRVLRFWQGAQGKQPPR